MDKAQGAEVEHHMSKRVHKRQKKRGSGRLTAVVATVLLVGSVLVYLSGRHAAALERVPIDHVCMVNDTVFPDRQIPVAVGAKTYFGCCEMCKSRLGSDESVRTAKDPVSGNSVDKAGAVIGALPSGRVLYFENERTLAEYQNQASK